MPNPSLTLWIDSASSRILSGWQSVSSASAPIIKQGDKIGVEVHWVTNYNGGSMAEVLFPPSVNMTLAVGRIDAAPTNGSFKFSYASQTTSALGYGATAAEVQTALNALSSITAEGGVAVTKVGTSYRIVWNNMVALASTLTVASNELYPNSSIGINTIKTGSVSVRQTYQVHIKQAPVANITSFVSQDASVMSVSTIHTQQFSGDSSVWRLSIQPEPREGSFLVTFSRGSLNYVTAPLSINSTAAEVVSALALISQGFANNWNCIKTGRYSWDISTTDSAIFNLGFNDGGIISFNSKYGVLDLNTAGVEDLLAGASSTSAVMEIQLEASGTVQTIMQTPCTILNDLIDSDSYTTVNWGDVLPADSVVRYDTSQNLTSQQKQQARDNIGAIDSSGISSVQSDNLLIKARLTTLENNSLTSDQVGALNAAPTLSATDPVLARSSVNTLLSGKANTVHTHIISDITNLDTTLNLKTDVGHTHTVADITDLNIGNLVTSTQLNTALSNKADVTHDHSTFNTLYVGNLTVPFLKFTNGSMMSSAAVDEAPINGFYYVRFNGFWMPFQLVDMNGTMVLTPA